MSPNFLLFFERFFLLFCLGFFSAKQAQGAACCGGGSSQANILASDDRSHFSFMNSYSDAFVDYVDSQNQWFLADESTITSTIKLDGAVLLSDLWQLGFSVPFIQKSKYGESRSDFGDLSGSLGYEYLPDWDYDPYRPRGVGYIQLVFPTGTPNEAAVDPYKLDTRGRGFWQLGAGTVLSKVRGKWDGSFSAEVHKAFSKEVSNSEFKGTLTPGWGGQASLGLGYNLSSWRTGVGLSGVYEDPTQVEGSIHSLGLLKRLIVGSASLGYSFPEVEGSRWSSNLIYSDQTLFGNPYNTSLERSISITLQKSVLR